MTTMNISKQIDFWKHKNSSLAEKGNQEGYTDSIFKDLENSHSNLNELKKKFFDSRLNEYPPNC